MNYPPLVAYDLISPEPREWQVTPLFSSPISLTKIADNACIDLKAICSEQEWTEDEEGSGQNGSVTKNHFVLDTNEELKKYFEDLCRSLIRGVLAYDTDIQITTSWFTETRENGSCVEHVHCNSWYSAVVYFDDYDQDSSKIQFLGQSGNICPMSTFQYNFFNARTWDVQPETGLMLMFPSESRHKVLKGSNSKKRYSLAFNIMPKGKTGENDSMFTY